MPKRVASATPAPRGRPRRQLQPALVLPDQPLLQQYLQPQSISLYLIEWIVIYMPIYNVQVNLTIVFPLRVNEQKVSGLEFLTILP